MRKVIVCNIVSLDGYFEGPGGDFMAMPLDPKFDTYNAERLAEADTMLVGKKTYQLLKSYWPALADDPEAPEVEREISRLNNAIDKMVVSDTLTSAETDPWSGTTQIVGRADAYEQIAELKSGPGRDILIFGSHTLWNDLLAHGLVDELHLMIGAGVTCGGTPAFETKPPASLRLLDTRTWDGSGLLLAQYAVESDSENS